MLGPRGLRAQKAIKGFQDRRGRRERRETKARPARKDNRARKGKQGNRARRAKQVLQARRDRKEIKAKQALQARRDPKEIKVQAHKAPKGQREKQSRPGPQPLLAPRVQPRQPAFTLSDRIAVATTAPSPVPRAKLSHL
jgi:hypothetical protein